MFYIMQAGWMFVFGDSPGAVILLIIVMTAALAFLLYRTVRLEYGSALAGLGSAILFLCLPVVQEYGRMIMADLPVALFSFGAMLAWADFMSTERRRSALVFAILAVTAILTKGNGYAVVFIPPVSIALSRRWDLLKKRDLWLSAALIGVLTVPWNIVTRDLIVPTMQHAFGIGFLRHGGAFYLLKLIQAPGIGVTLFALIGLLVNAILPIGSSGVKPLWASAFGMLAGSEIFHSVVPAGLEPRYLLGSFAVYILFMVAGINWVARKLSAHIRRSYAAAIFAALVGGIFFATVFEIPQKRHFGFDEVAAALLREPAFAKARILCSSSADGEGLLISEIAHRERRPGHIVTRATQMLARMGWNGQDYEMLAHTPEEVEDRLGAIPADVVVLDRTPGVDVPHHQLLLKTISNDPRWQLFGVYPTVKKSTTLANARIEVYRWTGPPRTDSGRLQVHLKPSPKVVLAPANQ
jgi:hypothetical protein